MLHINVCVLLIGLKNSSEYPDVDPVTWGLFLSGWYLRTIYLYCTFTSHSVAPTDKHIILSESCTFLPTLMMLKF